MRRVLHGDVSAAACVLKLLPKTARHANLLHMMAQADAADAYRQQHQKLHRIWGDGSLMSAALQRPHAAEPLLDDPDYAACMALVFDALVARADRPAP